MLTKKQNLLECIHGGNPDRYVNQFEYLSPLVSGNPVCDRTLDADGRMVDEWGVTFQVAGQPGRMPMHDMQHRVVTDITEWRKQVKPPLGCWDDPAIWEPLIEKIEAVDSSEVFRTAYVFPGMFERLHHLCEITETMMNLYDEPDDVKDLLKVITEVELEQAEAICKYLKPEALFHHDDWGSDASTLMAPDMFAEFLLEPYKQVYGYYKDHGVQLIVHHSDSYGATLVPYMIEMGIDIWQGAMLESNEIPKLVDEYGGRLTIMGGIEDQAVDLPGWTEESVNEYVTHVFDYVDRQKFFIPCLSHGLNVSIQPGVYDAITAAIDARSKLDFV